MRVVLYAVVALLLVGLAFDGGKAAAEVAQIRLAQQHDVTVLPLMIVQHEGMLENRVSAAISDPVTMDWVAPLDPNAEMDLLLSGQADAIVADLPALAAMWDKTLGGSQEIRAIAAIRSAPYLLLTRNPAVRRLRDFTDKDRIAVPAKASGPAVVLAMAAAREWGADRHGRLDPLMVARSHEDAATALTSPKSEIDADIAPWPYYYDELGAPGIRKLLTSYDVAGRHSAALVLTTKKFHDANPKLCAALAATLQDADTLIKKNPGEAAEIFRVMDRQGGISVEELTDLINDPDIEFTTTPAGVMKFAEFMNCIGMIQHKPGEWKDLFFPEAQDLPGG